MTTLTAILTKTLMTQMTMMSNDEFLILLQEAQFDAGTAYYEDYYPTLSPEVEEELEVLRTKWQSTSHKDDYDNYVINRNTYYTAKQVADNTALEAEPLGTYEVVEKEGGGEGEGEHVYLVVHFPKHDKYIEATASYYSGSGICDWSDWSFVRPYEVTITKYK
jgi:hypothetical protein